MLISQDDLKNIYQRIKQQASRHATPVQIFASLQTDSVCAVRIMLHLFHMDQVWYELHPVEGYGDIKKINTSVIIPRVDELHSILMINCGGNYDIHHLLFSDLEEVPDNVNVYIVDSQRPYALENVYYKSVFLLDDENGLPLENYPEMVEDGESDSESEDEDLSSDDSENDRPNKRRRVLTKEEMEKKIERRKAQKKVEEYYRFSKSAEEHASGILYKMAADLKKNDNALLWLSILGLTDMFINDRMSRENYDKHLRKHQDMVLLMNSPITLESTQSQSTLVSNSDLASHGGSLLYEYHNNTTSNMSGNNSVSGMSSVNNSSLNNSSIMNDTHSEAGSSMMSYNDEERLIRLRPTAHIQYCKEFQFHLMRHWTLFDSMYHSRYVATRLGIWEGKNGEDRLKNLLVKMNVNLNESKEPFINMSMDVRRGLSDRLERFAPDFDLGEELTYGTFSRQHGDLEEVIAADVVHGIDGLLENDKGMERACRDPKVSMEEFLCERWSQNFSDGMRSLSVQHFDMMEKGIGFARMAQERIVAMGTRLLEKNRILNNGSLCIAKIEEKNDFTNPVRLRKLAIFVINAYHTKKNLKKRFSFVISALSDVRNSYMIVGVPAFKQFGDVRKNEFGSAFESAREAVSARARHSGFQSSVIEVQKDDYENFITQLQVTVAVAAASR